MTDAQHPLAGIQALARQIHAGKSSRCFIVELAPVVQIPAELDKLFNVVDDELPGRHQFEEIARGCHCGRQD